MTVEVFCKNLNEPIIVPYGSTLQEIVEQCNIKNGLPYLGGLVNHKVRSLSYRVHKPSVIEFFDMTSSYGSQMYIRSLFFVLYKAVHDLYPTARLNVLHSISGGKYCELENLPCPLTTDVAEKIQHRMYQIVASDLPFIRKQILSEQAFVEYEKNGGIAEYDIFLDRSKFFTTVYQLDNVVNYYYSHLLPSTGYLKYFKLETYETGLLLKSPSKKRPTTIGMTHKMPKLFTVYKQFKEWGKRIGVPYISDLNKRVEKKDIGDLILTTEALQEKIWANCADEIKRKETKMILISGPSSSGKTTSCRRLSVQLSVLGFHPVQISVDDFFVERTETPLDEQGGYDFEALEAIDLKLFNNTLLQLLAGEEVESHDLILQLEPKSGTGIKSK